MPLEVVLGLGANLGSRMSSIRAALLLLACDGAVEVVSRSPFYDTDPVGPPQPRYANAAALVRFDGSLEALLDRTLFVERSLGRDRSAGRRWTARVIDVDLLWAEGRVHVSDRLRVPHAHLLDRPFALAPLLDVLPDPATELRDALARLGGPPPTLAEPTVRSRNDAAGLEVISTGPDADDALAYALTELVPGSVVTLSMGAGDEGWVRVAGCRDSPASLPIPMEVRLSRSDEGATARVHVARDGAK